jgi:nicotinamidase-related amidase
MTPRVPLALHEVVDPSKTALVVWDMQNGLGGHAYNGEELRPVIRELVTAARAAGAFVFWTRHVLPPFAEAPAALVRDMVRRQGVDSPEALEPFMQAGSADVAFLSETAPGDDDVIVEKSTRSLFVGTGAEAMLRDRGIQTLVLSGVSTDQGIEVTARHAFALGFFSVVVEDAVSSRTEKAHLLGLEFLRGAQTDVVTSAALIDIWAASR